MKRRGEGNWRSEVCYSKQWQISLWFTLAENALDSWIVITWDAVLSTHTICVQLTWRAEKMFLLKGGSAIWALASKDGEAGSDCMFIRHMRIVNWIKCFCARTLLMFPHFIGKQRVRGRTHKAYFPVALISDFTDPLLLLFEFIFVKNLFLKYRFCVH